MGEYTRQILSALILIVLGAACGASPPPAETTAEETTAEETQEASEPVGPGNIVTAEMGGPASGEPEALLAPGDVVRVTVDAPPTVTAGERGELQVHVSIADGYHVMSDQPSRPNYIATEIRFAETPGVSWGEIRYPPPTPFRLLDSTIRTFEGELTVGVPLEVAAGAEPGSREISGELRYQACTHGSCLFPATVPIHATLTIG